MKCLGVDPSTKTGLVLFDFSATDCKVACEVTAPKKYQGLARAEYLATRVLEHAQSADMVVIEGLSYASKFVSAVQVEIAIIIRYVLFFHGVKWVDVPPTSLKKFVTGKGNAKKELIMMEVYKRWQFESKTNNIADAYSLAMFGGALAGLLDMPKANMAAVKAVKSANDNL